MFTTILTSLLVFLSSLFPPLNVINTFKQPDSSKQSLQFQLRHLHAVSSTFHVVFADVPASASLSIPYTVNTQTIKTFRPPSFNEHARIRSLSFQSGRPKAAEQLRWEEEEIPGPDVESRETLLVLAKMTNDAYVEPDSPEWYELGRNWTTSYPFGWEPDADGFRGYVFATPDNSTVVLAIKGTSAELWSGGGPTARKDKFNDNLLFSCCCARISWTWTPVCGCWRNERKCDQNCLEASLIEDSLFYPIGTNLYNNISYMYPDSNIWVIGHSLGGAVASLLGATFGVPVVTFESPGEKLAANRLHLPSPPSTQHITHVYHTADPIAMGTCNGMMSSCSLAGYAMETRCHLGKSIVYDTVNTLGWSVDVRNHAIVKLIEGLLGNPWPPSIEAGREVPKAEEEKECVDCYSWEYGHFPEASFT
ncbi:hypothetical protein AMATHDRAFT_138431 [Amanita thiersii Skay4041]|uniref:triacylglycerol lipase n=1 Tax=Amanita thiersii Skay4041 TaxID=703135 RepID=A0A2A9NYQ7_9AGAR|nr:hypothetical protein AMATHDRAFT_138431 [Amanita thiersii Skay4041]